MITKVMDYEIRLIGEVTMLRGLKDMLISILMILLIIMQI
jgi:hypothetical protein